MQSDPATPVGRSQWKLGDILRDEHRRLGRSVKLMNWMRCRCGHARVWHITWDSKKRNSLCDYPGCECGGYDGVRA